MSLGGSTQSDKTSSRSDGKDRINLTENSSSLVSAKFSGVPPSARFSSNGRAYERYEAEKLAFIKHNPNASPRAYEEAMQAIAARYGL